jgi:hypothetical protein
MKRAMDGPQRPSLGGWLHCQLKVDTTLYGELAQGFERNEKSVGKKSVLLALQTLVNGSLRARRLERGGIKIPEERSGVVLDNLRLAFDGTPRGAVSPVNDFTRSVPTRSCERTRDDPAPARDDATSGCHCANARSG